MDPEGSPSLDNPQSLASEFESGRISSSATSLDNYFYAPPPTSHERSSTPKPSLSREPSARASLSDGDISPYEHIDLGETVEEAKTPKAQEEVSTEALIKKHSLPVDGEGDNKEKKAPNRKAPSRQAPSSRKPVAVVTLALPDISRGREESCPPPPPR